jgi:type IV secretory pathway protease TraF
MMQIPTLKGWGVLAGTGALAGLLACAAAVCPDVALVNESASLPRGLYVRQPGARLERGAVTAVEQPQAARAYLAELGAPPDMLLIKRVAAQGGDRVCRDRDRIRLPAQVAAVALNDRRGATLPVWSACRRLSPDEVFLLGDTDTSFDSRYFGPVRRSDLRGAYRLVLTW